MSSVTRVYVLDIQSTANNLENAGVKKFQYKPFAAILKMFRFSEQNKETIIFIFY